MFENTLSKWERFLMNIGWYRFCCFVEEWIYPAYYLKNLLFHRYDKIKIPQVKPYEYCDKDYLMLCANMQIIVDFIEKEEPEKYICWYKDDFGVDCGHKYGERKEDIILYPEYKDRWIMDIIKEIYKFWKVDYPNLQLDYDYLFDFWSDYLIGDINTKISEDGINYEIYFDKCKSIKTMEDLNDINLNWDIIDKYIDNREKLLDEKYVREIVNNIEKKLYEDRQKYLHLCIEVRPYLWT